MTSACTHVGVKENNYTCLQGGGTGAVIQDLCADTKWIIPTSIRMDG